MRISGSQVLGAILSVFFFNPWVFVHPLSAQQALHSGDSFGLGERSSLAMLRPTLFTNQEVKAIPTYRYVGGDKSLLYQHALSPLAAFLTNLLPESMAPNLITFSGLLFPLTATLLVLLLNPTLGLDAPRGVRYVRRSVLSLAYTRPYATMHAMPNRIVPAATTRP